jgi:hypothetical protein
MAQAFLQNYKFVRAALLKGTLFGLLLPMAVALAPARWAQADTFSRVYYDAATDQLLVTMRYRGTNPNHVFTLQWGQCQRQGSDMPEVAVEVLDSQALDSESNNYRVTTRFDLTSLPCRPAKVTLRTAPRFYVSLVIPAARASHP